MPNDRHVYVVDDDEAVRDSLAVLLEARDYQVRSFGLWIGLPQHRACGKLRAHEGILAAHEVDVAGPEQKVVVVLFEKRNGNNRKRSDAQ